ncbi:pyridoxal phosphate-dependent enzyme, D-cysteine desulfhydrase family [Desulfonatronospira thiodismutans ASO3-1]|uniref:Pyridoxal phosphate-dependent enzyme, D-cysteine desulfhydrase family n=1 Tax=Desulfonatronospira thiodismutans ASO3-1 TaxID=555779 RepID=D6SP28_9BACT|nr:MULTISPECIES: D-cysteine desulfhydrase [Desulfonatronospira]EFI34504.1 pyridoxal phosphate-dependent enzyme, D-cysteine desulfhydrase family [Desulfonatronospira thiodismutans ASO3-1]RQD73367.1 MAG: D-cysteine desulfhydrase [Desulfonatronospira sp. MSAO_Bac3]
MNFTRYPRRAYLEEATPIEFMENLSTFLGMEVNLFVKRDDLLPGAGGGNKTRKLEFCLADALEQGADTIITCGAVQSNHCRLTASWCCKENLDCHLILEERVKGTYHPENNGNNFLFHLLDVNSISVVPGGSDMMAEMRKKGDELKSHGKKPYIVPGGASNPIGALGYVACAEEIMNQLNAGHQDIDHIVVPSGSAGTHAGMVAGMIGTNANIPVSGINVSRPKDVQEGIVYNLAEETAQKLEMKMSIPREAVVCYDQYVGPGYSLPTDSMVEAVRLFAKHEAILLDPVYSGKAAAGLLDLVRSGHFPRGSNVLFLHTGGSPALYAYMPTFRKDN